MRGLDKCPLILSGHLLGVSCYVCGGIRRDVPGQQFCDAVDRVVGDVGQHVPQVAFRVDAVELCGAE